MKCTAKSRKKHREMYGTSYRGKSEQSAGQSQGQVQGRVEVKHPSNEGVLEKARKVRKYMGVKGGRDFEPKRGQGKEKRTIILTCSCTTPEPRRT